MATLALGCDLVARIIKLSIEAALKPSKQLKLYNRWKAIVMDHRF